MNEHPIGGYTKPTAEVLAARWQQSLSMFEMWTQIWRENPKILACSTRKVQDLMMTLEQVQQRHAAD